MEMKSTCRQSRDSVLDEYVIYHYHSITGMRGQGGSNASLLVVKVGLSFQIFEFVGFVFPFVGIGRRFFHFVNDRPFLGQFSI